MLAASLLFDLFHPESLLANPLVWVAILFQLWMVVDAARRQEWIWVLCILFFSLISALLYYFLVYRQAGPAGGSLVSGFELPGARDRRRIKELEAQIHHLDKAHHHSQLGDIYFQQGKLSKAESCYRTALARDAADADTCSHYAQCLLRLQRAGEAKPLLERVVAQDPKHDYGYTLMALAEAQTQLGERDAATATWHRVLEDHSYARARVQLAELLVAGGQIAEGKMLLDEVIVDDAHAPAFQRKRERPWVKRARATLAGLQMSSR
jgi:hypothetical protein